MKIFDVGASPLSGKEFTCQCSETGSPPVWEDPTCLEQLSPRTTTTEAQAP